jgi:hypothetical protein
MKVDLMKSSLLILAASAFLMGAGIAQAASSKGHGAAILIPAPSVESVTPPTESSVPPQTNPGTLAGPPEFGMPAVNSGTIAPLNQQTITNQPNFGALPGSPGSATYDPNAALPSLDNPGSALAPNPGTSAAGFGSPNTNTGTTPSLNNGG